jgi:hypothetical protein
MPSNGEKPEVAGEPATIHPPEFGVLLFSLASVAVGVLGWVTGTTILFCIGGTGNPGTVWTVDSPGARVAATGLLVVGGSGIAHWWHAGRARWPLPVWLLGLLLIGIGQLAALVAGWLR